MELPHSGVFKAAENRRYQEVIVFVHHFGGSPQTLGRHISFVNELGFDAVAFQLRLASPWQILRLPMTRDYKFGVAKVWEEQITDILNAVDRPKILMSFSSPSGATLNAASERPKGEIKGCVCEGGPFTQVRRGYWNYFTHEFKIKNPVLRGAMAFLVYELLGGSSFLPDSKPRLRNLPQDFPILSVRAWNDQMVSTRALEEYLEGLDHLAVEVLSIPEIGHLQGLSRAPNEYKPRVEKFLASISTPVATEASPSPTAHS
ncbi:MAG: hypothetical protein H6624_18595 [Bdellovibrionaceae bacterium]|nr:hypothetical protein [Bdellovibrionales bacterium]MCB9086355.1 hypothetical protein [Pseudobdellovibrionaceae bacterium]